MRRFLCAAVLIFMYSCSNKTKHWLHNYQHSKCLWYNTETSLNRDTLQVRQKMQKSVSDVEQQMQPLVAPYQLRINSIQKQIVKTCQRYFDKYNRITEEHNAVYGHLSTPEYERKVDANERAGEDAVATLENQLTAIQHELENNSTYRELAKKKFNLLNEMDKRKSAAKQKYKPVFDSLQKVIDNENKQFKILLYDLTDEEKSDFIQQRDSIKVNPCGSTSKL